VTDFPEFEYSQDEKRWVAMHHPFTMPYAVDIEFMQTDPGRVRAQAYDFVLNGVELGSGSIRIHRRDIQQKMFAALGFQPRTDREALRLHDRRLPLRHPAHGGFAFGLDRLVMMMLGAESLREVVAFPKTKDASCLMTNAPDFVEQRAA
jgi:aspartyl-tRNA synthetase